MIMIRHRTTPAGVRRLEHLARNDEGFTLPEAIMSLTILAIVLGIMAAGLAAGLTGLQRAKVEAVMSNFAQAKVEEVRSLDYADVGYPSGTPKGVIDPGNYDVQVQGVNMNVDISVAYVGSSTGLDVVSDPATPGPDGDGAEAAFDFGIDYKEVVVTISHDNALIAPIVTRTIMAPPNIGAHEGIANVIVNLGPYEPFAAADPLAFPYPKICLTNSSNFYISPTTDAVQVFPGIVPTPDTGPDFWYDVRLGLTCTEHDLFSDWHILPHDLVNDTDRVHAPVTTTVDTFLGIYLPASIDVRALDSGTGLPITSAASLVLDASKPHQFDSATGLWSISYASMVTRWCRTSTTWYCSPTAICPRFCPPTTCPPGIPSTGPTTSTSFSPRRSPRRSSSPSRRSAAPSTAPRSRCPVARCPLPSISSPTTRVR